MRTLLATTMLMGVMVRTAGADAPRSAPCVPAGFTTPKGCELTDDKRATTCPAVVDTVELVVGKTKGNAEYTPRRYVTGLDAHLLFECGDGKEAATSKGFAASFKQAGWKVVYAGRSMSQTGYVVTASKGASWATAAIVGGSIHFDLVEQAAWTVNPDAAAMEKTLAEGGKVTLYNISVEHDDDLTTQDSLQQIAVMLKKNPTWRLKLEGYSDRYSQEMMDNVLTTLVKKKKVKKDRVQIGVLPSLYDATKKQTHEESIRDQRVVVSKI